MFTDSIFLTANVFPSADLAELAHSESVVVIADNYEGNVEKVGVAPDPK